MHPFGADGETNGQADEEAVSGGEEAFQEGRSRPASVDGRGASAQNISGTKVKDVDPAEFTADGASSAPGGQVLRSGRVIYAPFFVASGYPGLQGAKLWYGRAGERVETQRRTVNHPDG